MIHGAAFEELYGRHGNQVDKFTLVTFELNSVLLSALWIYYLSTNFAETTITLLGYFEIEKLYAGLLVAYLVRYIGEFVSVLSVSRFQPAAALSACYALAILSLIISYSLILRSVDYNSTVLFNQFIDKLESENRGWYSV